MRESTLGGTMGDNLYGGTAPSHKTKCPQSNNPYGHSEECGCRTIVRASQVIPYADHPYEDCDATCLACNEQSWWHQLQAERSRERNR